MAPPRQDRTVETAATSYDLRRDRLGSVVANEGLWRLTATAVLKNLLSVGVERGGERERGCASRLVHTP